MSDELAFLAAIRQKPEDDLTRLVYADWLEERGDAESLLKSQFLRDEVRVNEIPRLLWFDKKELLILPLRKLAETLPVDWKMAVSRIPVENCGTRWTFICPRKWSEFRETADPEIRFCSTCEQNVYYCHSVEEARERASQRQCVTLDVRIRRKPGDVVEEPTISGMMYFVQPRTPEEQNRYDRRSDEVMEVIRWEESHSDPSPPTKPRKWWQFWKRGSE